MITVTFGNDKMGSLLIVKKDASDRRTHLRRRVPCDRLRRPVYRHDQWPLRDRPAPHAIRMDGLTPGMTVIAKEVRAKDGYILDDTPQSIKIKRNSVMTLEFRNQPKGGVLVERWTL